MTKHPRVNVLVTGLGPYPSGGGTIDPNISHVLTTLLPSHLSPNTALNPSPTFIKITTLSNPIKTEYADIREFCRALHATKNQTKTIDGNDRTHTSHKLLDNINTNDIDLVIHLGEARGWQFMSIERMAFKQGFTSNWWGLPPSTSYYELPDNKGRTVHDIGPDPWSKVPIGLQSAFDIDEIAAGANAILQNRSRFASGTGTSQSLQSSSSSEHDININKNESTPSDNGDNDDMIFTRNLAPNLLANSDAPRFDPPGLKRPNNDNDNPSNQITPSLIDRDRPIEIKPHREGGFYCCGFTHYESLANCYINNRAPNVLFCHVPGLEDEESLMWQKDGVLAVVVAAVGQVVRQRS